MKAGLPPDSWLTKDAKIYKFKAIIFEEETPNGRSKTLKPNQISSLIQQGFND